MRVKNIKSVSDLKAFCKETGLVFQSGSIYGGLSGFWDYGPLGTELRNRIKELWWNEFVRFRQDVVGIDGAIITHPKVWKASGHVDSFNDLIVKCKKCKQQFRADHIIEDELEIPADGFSSKKIDSLISKHKIKCPSCKKGRLSKTKSYNLMFKTNVGPLQHKKDAAYLRPETAQLIFSNFSNILDSTRIKLPFGIAQIGRGFRNEISPRNFIFRDREIEMLEIEYFIHPDKIDSCPFVGEVSNLKFNVLTQKMQRKNRKAKKMTASQLIKKRGSPWVIYWTAKMYKWFSDLGISRKNMRIREHLDEELAHYATSCFDIEYKFPFGWKELMGVADRGDYDLSKHAEFSKKKLSIFDEEKGKRVTPLVAAEPSLGLERAFMAFLIDAFTVEKVKKKKRRFLKLDKRLSPVHVAVFPLMRKDNLPKKAKEVYNILKKKFVCKYDQSGSIGKRYRRMDEVGTPYCITIDYDTLKDNTVTIRSRDSMKQKRIKISKLKSTLE